MEVYYVGYRYFNASLLSADSEGFSVCWLLILGFVLDLLGDVGQLCLFTGSGGLLT